jgi:hypothetical protein
MSTVRTDHQAATEAAILQAAPADLVRILAGPAVLRELRAPWSYERACLLEASAALVGERPDLDAALGHLSAGLAQAIRPDGRIATRPETVLLQTAFWLLTGQKDAADLIGRTSAGGKGGAA